ncbi:hypothetical protein [Deinococcus planocerae]|uniref:hypothetical protein n=1 Tax=Deinococcus planocerae TaxID=1737569 RepID=UPI000C7F6C80|nr:hypothetical protein [Deinococcus planocerae]
MKKLLALTISAGLATAGAQTLGAGFSTGGGIELGLTGGYANGLSGEAFVHAPNLAGPFGLKVGASLTRPSDALNDNASFTNTGTDADLTFGDFKNAFGATESGSHTVFSLDGTYDVGELTPGVGATLYAGGRYGLFRSSTSFEGDTTTYSSNAFGIGAGVMVDYALAGNLSLVGDLGVDQFFKSAINVSNGDSIATNDPSYSGFDNLFVRPGTVFKARIGIKTTF